MDTMIKANDLDGRAVVDLETAKKVGYVDEIYLDTDGARIAAYLVAEGSKLAGGGQKILMPAEAVETIGPEAIMVRPVIGERAEHKSFDRLPRLSHIKGRKVVSEGGKLLGTIDDVLLDSADGHIHGYTLKSASWTDSLFGGNNDHPDYVRGNANLRLGEDLLVVPEGAIVYGNSQHDRDESSSIDTLSTSARPASDTHMHPANPPHVDYAEPIGRTEPGHVEPAAHTGSGYVEPMARDDSSLADTTRPVDRVEHWDDVRPRFRSRWEQRTGGRGGLWEEHESGYRYGWEMASRPTYRGQSWTTAEPDLRRDWETRHHDRPWDRAVDAIRDAWDEVTGRDETDVAGYRSDRDYDDHSLGAIERLSNRPISTAHDDATVTESERLSARPLTEDEPDSRRSLL